MEGQVESIALWDAFSPAVFCSKFGKLRKLSVYKTYEYMQH